MPCYVDALEIRQKRKEARTADILEARGVMGEREGLARATELAESAVEPGNSPSPYRQLDLFDEMPYRDADWGGWS